MLVQQGLSATPGPPSIQTPRDSITPRWAEMKKTIKGIWEWGRREVWTLEDPKTGNLPWWRGPYSFHPYGPSMSSRLPFKPRCTPLQSPASRLTRQLPCAFAPWPSPPWALEGSYRLTSSARELKQRWISMEGSGWKRCLYWAWV